MAKRIEGNLKPKLFSQNMFIDKADAQKRKGGLSK
jgi:hypothetical protein